MSKSKSYCVVAQVRDSKKRIALTGPRTKEDAIATKMEFNRTMKKGYRYFGIAAFPYKQKK